MALPVFYHETDWKTGIEISLPEDTARHVVQVLRMQQGEPLQLTDGKGTLTAVHIALAEKKKCTVLVDEVVVHPPKKHPLHLAVAFTKNSSRNEWLLEKATELGVSSIIPLIVARSEKEKIRYERWKTILVSALIQSHQYYLPQLWTSVSLPQLLKQTADIPQKLIAHCLEGTEKIYVQQSLPNTETLLLIGPEGDFTSDEINLCSGAGFRAVDLGSQRLRTETAAMAAAAYFNFINHEK
jgi:16S rRNA (uracil1498-N3)-methyltransferase